MVYVKLNGSVAIVLFIFYVCAVFIIVLLLLFILTANGFLPGGSGTIRHNTQITHITQNYNKYNYNYNYINYY
jgi:hypothetical protein